MAEKFIQRWLAIDDMDIKRVDRKAREVTAYAAVFGKATEVRDKYGHYWEEINRAAFNRTISHGFGRVQVFYNHGRDLSGRPNILGAVPIATPKEIRPEPKGLVTVSRYNDGELADAVLSAWKGGQIRGQSFSGPVYQDRELSKRNGIPHVERMELGLREYGPTHSPMYEDAGLIAIRSQDDLAELIRSILADIGGTQVPGSPLVSSTGVTPPGPGTASTTDPGQTHSSRNSRVARARAAKLKLEYANASEAG